MLATDVWPFCSLALKSKAMLSAFQLAGSSRPELRQLVAIAGLEGELGSLTVTQKGDSCRGALLALISVWLPVLS